jgi:hypothetical protein
MSTPTQRYDKPWASFDGSQNPSVCDGKAVTPQEPSSPRGGQGLAFRCRKQRPRSAVCADSAGSNVELDGLGQQEQPARVHTASHVQRLRTSEYGRSLRVMLRWIGATDGSLRATGQRSPAFVLEGSCPRSMWNYCLASRLQRPIPNMLD